MSHAKTVSVTFLNDFYPGRAAGGRVSAYRPTSDNVSYVRLLTLDFPGNSVFCEETPLPTSKNHARRRSPGARKRPHAEWARISTRPAPAGAFKKQNPARQRTPPNSPRRTRALATLTPGIQLIQKRSSSRRGIESRAGGFDVRRRSAGTSQTENTQVRPSKTMSRGDHPSFR